MPHSVPMLVRTLSTTAVWQAVGELHACGAQEPSAKTDKKKKTKKKLPFGWTRTKKSTGKTARGKTWSCEQNRCLSCVLDRRYRKEDTGHFCSATIAPQRRRLRPNLISGGCSTTNFDLEERSPAPEADSRSRPRGGGGGPHI